MEFAFSVLHVSWKALLFVKIAVVVRHAAFVVVAFLKMGFGYKSVTSGAEP